MSKGTLWQHPFVNLFKHLNVGEWKKSNKEGDVLSIMDKTLKCTVYRITGSIPAGNFIQMPKTSSQTLGLTGRYLYLLFKPIAGKHFVIHMDVVTAENLVIRLSISNLFKEFKSTSTWLQFPYVCPAAQDSVEGITSRLAKTDLQGPAPVSSRWAILKLDFQYILSIYLNRKYSFLKNIKLCSNMFVKNVFTSDIQFEPEITIEEARQSGLLASPLPREMTFPTKKGQIWQDFYDFIRFPSCASKVPFDSVLMTSLKASRKGEKQPSVKMSPQRVSPKQVNVNKPGCTTSTSLDNLTRFTKSQKKDKPKVTAGTKKELPEIGINGDVSVLQGAQGEVHLFAHQEDDITVHRHDRQTGLTQSTKVAPRSKVSSHREDVFKSLKPDPILSLRKIAGFGGCTTKQALWNHTGTYIIYPCHAVIVTMDVASGHQRFFIGHTEKVSALSLSGNGSLLASAQTGAQSVVRVWKYQSGECLAMFRTHVHSVSCISFSCTGSVLCGVGKDGHGKNMIVVWDTSRAAKKGEVTVLAKAHTDVDVAQLKFAPFDETRMVSCGRDNIRVWRIRKGTLRSAAVNLGDFHVAEFTDLCFECYPGHGLEPADKMFYACTRSGHIFQIDYARVSVAHIRRLLPTGKEVKEKSTFNTGPGIAINAMSMSEAFCVTGSDDGFLRLWPLDFSNVFLEAEHEGPVTAVAISPDGLLMLAGTSTGNLGYLDISTRSYTTVMRSHTAKIRACCVDPARRQLATVSEDHTIRLWDLDSLQQLFDFHAPDECPTTLCYHPTSHVFACGFDSGTVRIFNVATTSLLAELKQHKGVTTGLLISPNGSRLYSCSATGTLALHDASDERYPVMRLLGNMVAKGDRYGPDMLSMSEDGRHIAYIGPTEFTVSVVDGKNLDEVLRVDINCMNSESSLIDSALRVHYATRQLLVCTTSSNLLRLDAKSGRLLNKTSGIHRAGVTSMNVCSDCRHLATAGDKVVKIWDFNTNLDVNFQVFIGHSEHIHQVLFTPDALRLISVGEAIFMWDFFGSNREPERLGMSPLSRQDQVSQKRFPSPVRRSLDLNGSLLPRSGPPKPATPINRVYQEDVMEDTSVEQDEEILVGPDLESRSEISSTNESDVIPTSLGGSQRTQPHRARAEVESEDLGESSHLDESCKNSKPSCSKHFVARPNQSQVAQRRYIAPPNQAGLKLRTVLGFNGNGRGNVLWHPESGLFAYTSGCIIILEDLNDSTQRHLMGHVEEISVLALQHDAEVMASASGSRGLTSSQICLWDIAGGVCKKALSYHEHDVVCLAFSRDDRFLVSVGDYRDCSLVVWSTQDFSILAASCAALPVHDLVWDPHAPNEFSTVGEKGTVLFWLLDETHERCALNIHEAEVPNDLLDNRNMILGDVSFTCLHYGSDSVLYIGTNTGVLSAWDTRHNSCFMIWDADQAEIDVIMSRFGSSHLITGGVSKHLRLWSVYGIGQMKSKPGLHSQRHSGLVMEDEMVLDGTITAAQFDDTLDVGVVATSAGTLWYINWIERNSIRLVGSHGQKINSLVFSEIDFFASCSEDGGVRLFSLSEMESTVQFQVLDQSCNCLVFSPVLVPINGQQDAPLQRLAAGYSDGTIRVFDLAKVEMALKMQPHSVAVTKIVYSADGHVLISGASDGLVAISSPTTGMTMRVINDHKGVPITDLQVAPFQDTERPYHSPHLWLVASADRRVSLWSADWPKDFCEMVDWLSFPAPAFAPDGTTFHKRDLVQYQLLPPSLARFSPIDPDTILCIGYGMQKQVLFYSISHKKVLRTSALTHWATSFDVNPLGNLYVTGSNERLVKLMDYYEGSFQDFVGHNSAVQLLKFSPSGKLLFSVSNNEILVWDVAVL